MGLLRYVCWAFCLAQVAFVHARPDFGTYLEFSKSASISAMAGEISSLVASVDDELHFELSELIIGSDVQLELLGSFAEDLSVKGRAVSDALESAVSNTYDVSSTFGSVLSAYGELIMFINDNNEQFISSVAQSFGSLLAEELLDSMSYAFDGLLAFREALEELQEAMEEASEEEDVPSALFAELLSTMRVMRAHLPVVVYVFQRAGLNMQLADMYFVAYDSEVGQLTEQFEDDLELSAGIGSYFMEFLDGKLDYLSEVYMEVYVDLLSGLSESVLASPEFGYVETALNVIFADGPGLLDDLLTTHVPAALEAYYSNIAIAVLDDYYDGPEIYVAPDELVYGLIESDVYAEYCFHKFRGLVADVPTLGRIRMHECFDTEQARLCKLKRLIKSFILLLSYDVEDTYRNYEVCVRQGTFLDYCLEDLNNIYTSLGAEHTYKYGALQQLIETELVASQTRLQICLAATDFYTFDYMVPVLVEEMQSCYGGYGYHDGSWESHESYEGEPGKVLREKLKSSQKEPTSTGM